MLDYGVHRAISYRATRTHTPRHARRKPEGLNQTGTLQAIQRAMKLHFPQTIGAVDLQ